MALLGIGAAGTLTATSRRLAGAEPRTAIGWAGALFALTAVGAYVTADRIPLDTYRIGADASQLAMAGALLHRGHSAVHLRWSGCCRGVAPQPQGRGRDLRRESGWIGRRCGPGPAAARPGRIGRHDPAGRRPGRSRASRRGASASGHRRRPGQHCPRCRGHRHRARGAASLDPLAARPSPSASRYAPPRHQAVRQFARGHPPERRVSHDHRPQPELRRSRSKAPHRPDGRRRKRGGAGRSPLPRPWTRSHSPTPSAYDPPHRPCYSIQSARSTPRSSCAPASTKSTSSNPTPPCAKPGTTLATPQC